VPDDLLLAWDFRGRGQTIQNAWNELFAAYQKAHPSLAAELVRRMRGDLPSDFAAKLQALLAQCQAKAETIATRKSSQNAIEVLAPAVPEMMGGSAD
jgi:transketolase